MDFVAAPHEGMETKLRETLSELKDIKFALDQTAIVAITDLCGRIIYVNDRFCQISKYSRDELIGQNHRILKSGYHPEELYENLWRTIASGRVWRGEIKNKAKDGSFYWVDTTIVPFTRSTGKPYQYVSFRFDITEKKHNQEIIEQERERREFLERLASIGEMAADISHEIKNPLAAILLKTQLMRRAAREHGLSREETLKAADTIERGVERIEKIIESVRSLSRDAKDDPLEIVPIQTIIDETLEFSKARFRQGQVTVKVGEISNKKIRCRSTQISQVLVNLLNNAFDAVRSLPERWIKLEVVEQGAEIIFSVTDSGNGIPAEVRNKIMQPFFTTKGPKKGTGLGLSISKGILEGHGGSLEFDANQPHTTFLARLPLRESL